MRDEPRADIKKTLVELKKLFDESERYTLSFNPADPSDCFPRFRLPNRLEAEIADIIERL